MNIIIPNGSSPRNIGDLASMTGLMSLFKKDVILKVHGVEPFLYGKFFNNKFSPTLYSWAVFEDRRILTRVKRVTELLYSYLTLKYLKKTLLISKELDSLIKDYRDADVILFVGGGYLRSQKGMTQALNLLMTLLLFQFARTSKAKKIIAPISFGPFAYKWQEIYAAKVIKEFNLVSSREKYSYDLLKKYAINNLILSSDMSFLLPNKRKKRKIKSASPILGFTIRKWLEKESQEQFEKEFLNAILAFSKTTGATIQPIVQVDAPEYGDFDYKLTKEIVSKLKDKGVHVNPVKKINDLEGASQIYSGLSLLLGMRMHSNILAALEGVPFVAISYEHKTDGIAEDLGISEYVIRIEEINKDALYLLLNKAYANSDKISEIIKNKISVIQKREIKQWVPILTT